MNFDSQNSRLDLAADALLENVALRSEAENYIDESFSRLHYANLEAENERLRESIDWESSPISSLRDCLDSSWRQLDVSAASEAEIAEATLDLLQRLQRLNQEIWRADHLSNRRLYKLLVERVLPDKQKRLKAPRVPTVWTFENFTEDQELDETDVSVWLTYYATAEERRLWAQEHNAPPPQRQTPPYARRFPSLNGGCGCESCD